MLTDQEKENLNLLIKSERPPENGMEKHFLRVLKREASPCTKKEKEWHQYWLQNIKGNTDPIAKNVNANPKSELDNIFTILFLGGQLKGGLKRDWSFGAMWMLDFFFDGVRLGIEIDYGKHHGTKEKELALELHGITLARFTKDEVFGDRRDLLKKFDRYWRQAEATTKRCKAKAITKQRHAETAAREQDRLRKEAEIIRARQLNKKLDNLEQSRKKTGRMTDNGFAGGWTSLKQGERKVGDTATKQYINEGIAGTREENKKMRGQLWGDMRNRGRGR